MQNERIDLDIRPERNWHGQRSALHPVLRMAFDALSLAGVRWCLLRPPSSLSAPTGDVDLLVDRTDYARTGRILRALGFGTLRVWGRSSNPEAFYLLYHPPTGCNLCFHVATELSFGPGHAMNTSAATGCLERRRKRDAVFEPDPKDAFWILLLHCLLDKGNVAPRYRKRLEGLAGSARAEDELAGVAEALCPAGWDASKVIGRVGGGDWTGLDQLAGGLWIHEVREQPLDRTLQSVAALLAVLSSRSVRRYAWEKWWPSISRLLQGQKETPSDIPDPDERLGRVVRAPEYGKTLRHTPRSPQEPGDLPASTGQGLSVALLGPDGVGKSTLAANLADSLPSFYGVRMLYMGLGYAGLPKLARLPIPGSLAAVGLATLWWRYLVALYHRRRGRLVVFDRYTYDAWLPPGRRLTKPQRLARLVWARACPAPDLVFLLDAPGEVVYERRGESTPTLLEAARQDFLSLRGRIPCLQVVDASRPEEAVRDDLADRICRYVRPGKDLI